MVPLPRDPHSAELEWELRWGWNKQVIKEECRAFSSTLFIYSDFSCPSPPLREGHTQKPSQPPAPKNPLHTVIALIGDCNKLVLELVSASVRSNRQPFGDWTPCSYSWATLQSLPIWQVYEVSTLDLWVHKLNPAVLLQGKRLLGPCCMWRLMMWQHWQLWMRFRLADEATV